MCNTSGLFPPILFLFKLGKKKKKQQLESNPKMKTKMKLCFFLFIQIIKKSMILYFLQRLSVRFLVQGGWKKNEVIG